MWGTGSAGKVRGPAPWHVLALKLMTCQSGIARCPTAIPTVKRQAIVVCSTASFSLPAVSGPPGARDRKSRL